MVLILDLTAAPDNYNAPVSKAASLMDNYTFYRFSKICELFVNGKDIEEIALIFHNTRSGNPQVEAGKSGKRRYVRNITHSHGY